jgi:serine protease inhibitor
MQSKLFLIIYIAATLILISSCNQIDPDPTPANTVELRKKSIEIIEADHIFAFELFNEIYKGSEKDNFMISPLSVSYALGMTYNGAAGTTLEAFEDVLHLGELTNQEVNESYKDLMGQLVTLDEQVEFSIANSIWYRLGYEVLEEFITTNQEYFDAAVEELDFADPGAVDIINDWIEEKTNDKIVDMLDFIPPGTVMYLINAIYFNADWKYQFDPEDTYEGDFTMESGAVHKTNYMKLEGGFNYASTEDFTAVELPYGDSAFSMVVMLPAMGNNLTDLVESLDNATLDTWSMYATPQTVNIHLPKFKYEFKQLLNDPLINLGLGVAFGDADFTRINPAGGIYISRVIHQTFIDVSEEGTEAAAATIVELRENAVQTIHFKADQPFVYLIKENSTNAIMFLGKVGKPVHKD